MNTRHIARAVVLLIAVTSLGACTWMRGSVFGYPEATVEIGDLDNPDLSAAFYVCSSTGSGPMADGVSSLALEEYEAAYGYLSEAANADNDDANALFAAGLASELTGRMDEAQRYYGRAYHMSQDPDHRACYLRAKSANGGTALDVAAETDR